MERRDGDGAADTADAAHDTGVRFASRDRRLLSTAMAMLSWAVMTPTSSRRVERISTRWGGAALAWLALAECASAQDRRLVLTPGRDTTIKVERGGSAKVLEWLNIDTTDCLDRGHASIEVTQAPLLGTLEVRRSHVITEEGICAGHRLPTLFVTYNAGFDAGVDEFRFTVIGTRRAQVQRRMTVLAPRAP